MKLCPTCDMEFNSEEHDDHLPFCSERCRLLDLGAWLSEKHRIVSNEMDMPTEDEITEYIKH